MPSIQLSGLTIVLIEDFLTCASKGGWLRAIE
jgi:hypothetical protein